MDNQHRCLQNEKTTETMQREQLATCNMEHVKIVNENFINEIITRNNKRTAHADEAHLY